MRRLPLLLCTALVLPLLHAGAAQAAYTPPTTAGLTLSHINVVQDPDNAQVLFGGDLTNNNSAAVINPMIDVRVYDAQNAYIDGAYTAPVTTVVAPGQTIPWQVSISGPTAGWDHYGYTVTSADLSYQVANNNFTSEIFSTTEVTDDYGTHTEVVGYLTNTNARTADYPQVWVVYRNPDGGVVDILTPDVDNPNGSVDPGTKLRWSFQFDGARRDRDLALGTPQLIVAAENDPSPLRADVGTRPGAVLPYNGTIAPTVKIAKSTTNGYGVDDGTTAVLQYLRGTSWTNVTTAVVHSTDLTGDPGYVTFAAQRPRTSTTYRAVTPANTFTTLCLGAAFRVQVRMAISAAWSASTIHTTSTAYLSGKTSVAHAGQRVYLQRYYSGAWHTVTYQNLSSTSTYRFGVHPGKVGTYYYRVLKTTDSVNYASTTAKMTLKVS